MSRLQAATWGINELEVIYSFVDIHFGPISR